MFNFKYRCMDFRWMKKQSRNWLEGNTSSRYNDTSTWQYNTILNYKNYWSAYAKITCVVACGEWIVRSRAASVSNTYSKLFVMMIRVWYIYIYICFSRRTKKYTNIPKPRTGPTHYVIYEQCWREFSRPE